MGGVFKDRGQQQITKKTKRSKYRAFRIIKTRESDDEEDGDNSDSDSESDYESEKDSESDSKGISDDESE